jgi:O-antigen/teichoic acid export membrane protein
LSEAIFFVVKSVDAFSYGELLLNRIPPYLLVTVSAWVSRILTAVIQLFSIRILLSGLGTERYSAYLLLASLAGWYSLLDFGLGSSLQNFVAEQRAKSESYAAYVRATALLALPVLALAVGVLYLTAPMLAPFFLKQVGALSGDEKTRAFFLSGLLFSGTTVGSIVYKLWYAEQKGYLANLLPAVASLMGLGGIWLVMNCSLEEKLLGSLLAFNLPPATLSLLALARILIATKGSSATSAVLKPLLLRALKFWVFTLMVAATLQIDYLIMSQLLAAQDVVVYNITTRIFGIGYFLFSSLLAALYPSFTAFMMQGRWAELRHMLKRNLTLGLLGMLVFTGIMAFSMPWVLPIFAPRSLGLHIPTSFILLVGTYQLALIWVSVFSTVLQSASLLRVFLVWTPLQAIVSATCQWWLAKQYGVYGIILGLLISYLVIAVWFLPLTLRRHIRERRV